MIRQDAKSSCYPVSPFPTLPTYTVPEQVDHVPGKDLGAVGVGAPRGHQKRAEGRVAPQLQAGVALEMVKKDCKFGCLIQANRID